MTRCYWSRGTLDQAREQVRITATQEHTRMGYNLSKGRTGDTAAWASGETASNNKGEERYVSCELDYVNITTVL